MDIYFKGVFPSEQEYALTSWKMLDTHLSQEWKGYRENLMPRQFLKQKKGRRTQHLAEHFFPFILTIGRGVQVLIHHYDM